MGEELFKSVNFKIDRCGVYLIRGGSGEGKTTLLNIIADLTSSRGIVRNDYIDNMSYVFQNSYLINHLTIRENLDLYKINYKILRKYKLYNKLDSLPSSLSRGEKSRVALIIGLYSDSKLLLIDEPITNLDKVNASFVIKEIFKFRNDKIIILVSHENKRFIRDVNGVIDIKDKTVRYKEILKGEYYKKEKKKKINIDFKYLKKEFLFYKKENVKRYCVIFLVFIIMFVFLCFKSYFLSLINKDIGHSVDYNKFYLSECNNINNKGIILKNCTNPSEESLSELEQDNIEYLFNYDIVINSLYSRDDLSVMNNENILLKEGRYPSEFSEVIANDTYSLGDIINLNSNLIISDYKNDIYKKEIELRVVGIYHDLVFFDDSSIYFDYDLVDKYYKSEMLINNGYSVFDYYKNLELDNYKYLTFTSETKDYLSFNGNKYEFYKALKDVYYRVSELLFYILCFSFIYCLYIIYRLTKEKLIISQTSNCFLIANSLNVYKSVFLSCFFDLFIINVLLVFLIVLSILFKVDIMVLYLFYLIAVFLILIETFLYYSRRKMGALIRREVW